MKKVLQKGVMEDARYFCDTHPDRECFSEIECISWYGSKYDMMHLQLHLCDECLEKFYSEIKEKFNVEPKEIEL